MNYNRERNRNIDLNNLKLGTQQKTSDNKSKAITTAVVLVLMLASAMGPAGVALLIVFAIFAVVMAVAYMAVKAQGAGDAAGKSKFDVMRTIREKSEKEGDPMFKEARAYQKRNLTREDYARLDRCSHEECLKSLLEAGIIDRAEYVERIHKLNCSSAHR